MPPPMHSRILSQPFLEHLKSGYLAGLVQRVRDDATLEFAIRSEEVVVYYRGGRLVSIHRNGQGLFEATVHKNYLKKAKVELAFPWMLGSEQDVAEFVASIPHLKEAMDLKLGAEPKDEREYQQLVMRENNDPRKSNGTDYLICDIEYSHPDISEMRLDMVAARWPSSSQARRRIDRLELALVEMKFGDAALGSQDGKKSGILEHFEDMLRFSSHFEFLKAEMADQIVQKAILGLLRKSEMDRHDKWEKVAFKPLEEGVDWILLLAGHDPARAELRQELSRLQRRIMELGTIPFNVKVAVSTFMGYGLYDQGIVPLDEFLERYDRLIGPVA